MEIEQKKLQNRIEDYSRFLITLVILSIYFYLGMIITNFLEPTDKGKINIFLLLSSLSISGVFLYLIAKWRQQLNKLLEE